MQDNIPHSGRMNVRQGLESRQELFQARSYVKPEFSCAWPKPYEPVREARSNVPIKLCSGPALSAFRFRRLLEGDCGVANARRGNHPGSASRLALASDQLGINRKSESAGPLGFVMLFFF
jgi:hypothetical protein